MKREWLQGYNGYQIPVCNQIAGEERVLIVCHGFGSSKDSPMVEALQGEMPRHAIGTYSFDFPCHGESPAQGVALRVENCLSDLAAVEDRVRRIAPESQLSFFGSSFGAYIVLLYLARRGHEGGRAFLRSAAVDMHGIFQRWFRETPPVWHLDPECDADKDYFTLDYEYQREMRISRAFIRGLEENPVDLHYPKAGIELCMIHGDADSTAPYEVSRRFAKYTGAELHTVSGGEHRLMGAGEMKRVLDCAVRFLSK